MGDVFGEDWAAIDVELAEQMLAVTVRGHTVMHAR